MIRLPHGATIPLDAFREATEAVAAKISDVPFAFTATRPPDLKDFDFLFPKLQENPVNLLPEARETRDNLIRLGRTMIDTGSGDSGDSAIPAAYTYFGQFVDHDITLETASATADELVHPDLAPLSLDEIRTRIRNLRTATLDLDSVYGFPAPRDRAKMRIGHVTSLNGTQKPDLRPPGRSDYNDVPRKGRSAHIYYDRAALIGDPRNDENTIVAQLQVAFLRAHNALIDRGLKFEEAQKNLRQHYQHIIVKDFLPRICDPSIVEEILQNGNRIYNALAEPFFLPLEFSLAAYRFGHSMVRAEYDFNLNFNGSGETGTEPASLGRLFTFSALSGDLGPGQGFDTLPENWIIEWERFVDAGELFNNARRIDPKLVEPLFHLRDFTGAQELGDKALLAVRNLLRGYLLRIPTGQAVAGTIQAEWEIPVLTPEQVAQGAASEEQIQVLHEAGFLERTPLWYYILAEAALFGGGQRLGPAGSILVAEVLIGLVRRSKDSILRSKDWKPNLDNAQPVRFELADLLHLAGVLRTGEPG